MALDRASFLKVLEDSYNQIMAHVERVLNDRYSYVAE